MRTWLLDRIDLAKWALWNGQLSKTLGHLSDLRVWTRNARADPSWLQHPRTHLSELTSYLDANADSLPNIACSRRTNRRSTAECRSSAPSRARGSSNTVVSFSNAIPCFARFAAAFVGSHSNTF